MATQNAITAALHAAIARLLEGSQGDDRDDSESR
jgi:hypothetical protein